MSRQTSFISVTDIFCGAGGSTTGATKAGAEVRIAINHWQRALETHSANYPGTRHILTDISTSDPRNFPATTVLLASPECTNHTLAKGKRRKGQAQIDLWEQELPDSDNAEERSRCTMWDPLRFAEIHDYPLIILENVVDARYWRMWDSWLHAWQSLDYTWEIVYLNSMFAHPTPQSRDRMYVVLWKRTNRKPDLRITPKAFCATCAKDILAVQSWKDPLKPYGKYGRSGQYIYRCPECAGEVMPYYYCAATAIDWSLPITRICDRAKPLKEKTLARIRYGLEKFQQREPFFVQMNKSSDRVRSVISGVFPTQTADNGLGLVSPSPFLMSLSHGPHAGYVYEAQKEPLGTQTGRDDIAMCVPPFIAELRHSNTPRSLSEAFSTFCAGGEHHALVTPPFLMDHIHEYRVRSLTEPLSTVVAEGNHQSIVVPPAPAWLMTYYNNGQLSPVEEPAPTVTTLERHALVTASATPTIAVEDCGFRMLDPHEIKAAMAFPAEYTVTGNRREQVKQLGNAVTPPVMQLLVERALASLA